ncbi:MAG: hypothetical protein R2778_11540 [Saprospiraceae bacterium]
MVSCPPANHKNFYDPLWKPLEPHLKGINTIYYSPSGLLHRLNLAAIPVNLDSVLADCYQLVELGSTRQLVVPTEVNRRQHCRPIWRYPLRCRRHSNFTGQCRTDSVSITSRGELSFSYTDSTLRAYLGRVAHPARSVWRETPEGSRFSNQYQPGIRRHGGSIQSPW